MLVIRAESPQDRALIDKLNRVVFAGHIEADLIEKLRAGGLVVSSLVAVADAGIVGHILFSDLDVRMDGRWVAAVSLAPMAVRPGEQRRGIGSQLVRAGLDDLRHKGRMAVLVLGHPAYYPRFGFSAELARKLSSPYAGPAFMALELVPGALAGKGSTVRYPPMPSAPDACD